MGKAKVGKVVLPEDEVMVVQYRAPFGKKVTCSVQVGVDVAALARDMVLSMELLSTGMVALYARMKTEVEEDELTELAENGPGARSPRNMLITVIKRVAERAAVKR